MKRRQFLALGFSIFPCFTQAMAVDYRAYKPKAWMASSINEAAMALYGREKFSTIQKSEQIELIVPRGIVKDREEIFVTIRSDMKAKSVAIFQDANPKSLVAVFHVNENSIIEYEFNMRMAFKGTVFAVIEGIDGRLFYTREFIDILTLSCMA
jgi:sulfur-oxidizing protein SoxY